MKDLSYDYLLGYYRGITGLGDSDPISQAVKTLSDYCRSIPGDCVGCRFDNPGRFYVDGCKLREALPEDWTIDE